jgi:CheY-like chemotaxis protein
MMSALAGLKVLVVEDEAAISFLVEGMLVGFGCEVAASAARLSSDPNSPRKRGG